MARQHLVSAHGYWAIALIVGLESMGIPLPGETTLVLAAIYAVAHSTLNIWLVIGAAAADRSLETTWAACLERGAPTRCS